MNLAPCPTEPIVTWTTPMQRAMSALNRASELLESKKLELARVELAEHMLQMRVLYKFLEEHGLEPNYAPKDRG